jgi:ActD protein
MARIEPAFLVAEFAEAEPMLEAATKLRQDGWRVELHTPFPVKGMKEALGFRERTVPHAFVVGGVVGAVSGFLIQAYANWAFPLDIGGRPLIAVPAFMMIVFELMVLGSVLTGLVTMFVRNRLPRLHHPLFDAERFHLASDDRFFVSLALEGHGEGEARAMLGKIGALSVSRVGGELPE